MEMEIAKVIKYIEEGFVDPLNEDFLKKFLLGNSKRIRSRSVLLYTKALNLKLEEDVYKVLAAGEVIHNASLLHDDVLDSAEERRGEKTLTRVFNPKIAILSGDYLLNYALEKLLSISNIEIFGIFKNATNEMIKGEIKQYFLRGVVPDLDSYIQICNMKTASLFCAMMKAVLRILKIENSDAIKFAKLFGEYFQLKNDLDEVSKSADRLNGIFTLTDILGIEKASVLLDNYKEEMFCILKTLQEGVYRTGLEDLLREL